MSKEAHYTTNDGFRLGVGLVFGMFVGSLALIMVLGLLAFFIPALGGMLEGIN